VTARLCWNKSRERQAVFGDLGNSPQLLTRAQRVAEPRP